MIRISYFIRNPCDFFAEILRCASGNKDVCLRKSFEGVSQELDGARVPLHGAYVQVDGVGRITATAFGRAPVREAKENATVRVLRGKGPRDALAVAEIRGAPLADNGEGRILGAHFSNFSSVIPG
jgi:hypothetical protein